MKKLERSKRKLKRTGKAGIACKYCRLYRNASVRRGGNDKPQERLCRTKYVSADNKACENFIPAQQFWCERNQYWVDLNVCIFRRDNINLYNAHALCKKCTQGEDIDRVVNANRPKRILKRRGA